MPETTQGFPYPDGGDPFGAGSQAIEDLAQYANDYAGAAAWLLRSTVQSIPLGVSTAVAWTAGSSALSPEFALSAGDTILTYTGPTRWFAYDFKGTWFAFGQRQLTLQLNGTDYHGETADLSTYEGALGNRAAGLVPLASGYTLNLNAYVADGGVARDLSPVLIVKGL